MSAELPRCERRRLGLEEEDWQGLVVGAVTASRTRGGGNGRPSLERASFGVSETVVLDDSDSNTTGSGSDADDESSDDETVSKVAQKPPHTRVLLEVSHLKSVFAKYPCPECMEPLELKIRTVCIASNLELICNNKECSYVSNFDRPCTTTIHVDERCSYERMTDYAANVLYVLGFMSVGDGPTEAGRLLGLLGLPNDTTMMNRSFGIIESRIAKHVRLLCDEIIGDNIDEEAKLSMSEFDYNAWKNWLKDDSLGPIPVERMPHLDACYDMAWQQKGSGHVYNSQSGHGSLFGRYSRKIIGLVIKSKMCCYCNSFKKKNPGLEVPPHECWQNHEGSSGSMESSGAVDLLVEAFDKRKVVIKRLCCDDDSSVRADCQWSNADYLKNYKLTEVPMVPITVGKNKGQLQPRKDNGKLPAHIPEPVFVADPNHRRKGLTGELIKLDKMKADQKFTMTWMDSTRIGKNFGYMARTLKDRDPSTYCQSAKACLEHHFDCHDYCGDWCRRKHETEAARKQSVKYYRCKTRDAKLYAVLQEKMERFCTFERLNEMAHSLDTNKNEAFNQICTWFAPKNKVFAGSCSLSNRIAFAVGINSLGSEVFFKRLLKSLGIPLSNNVAYYLQLKETCRSKRLAKSKTREAKIIKNKRKYDKLAEHTKKAKMELHKRQGTYRRGMNLDDPVVQDDEAPKRKKSKPNGEYCEFCGAKGHLTKRSKKCTAKDSNVKRFNKLDGSLLMPGATGGRMGPTLETSAGSADALEARQDCDRMDALPFDAEYESEPERLAPLTALLLEDGGSDVDDPNERDPDGVTGII
jgi:hypothetical protein